MRLLRLRINLTQAELAERVDLSEEQISNIERGMSWVSEMTVELLAGALRVDERALFDFSENASFEKEGGRQRRSRPTAKRSGRT